MTKLICFLLFAVFLPKETCRTENPTSLNRSIGLEDNTQIIPGAWQTARYFPLLEGMRFGLVCNHTATIGMTHLVDTLIRANLSPAKMFAPEHGFRGDMPDGHLIGNMPDKITGLPVISIYGQNKKPQPEDLKDLDLMVFDIQDVGVRCYTYLSTLHYVMEACAEAGIPLIILDRPNPNGHYIDGPIMEPAYFSFVGLHPVPLVYGMTIGEYAKMINGEGWLADSVKCNLEIIPLENYTRLSQYNLPQRPSPNLPNMLSVYLYPSLCFFEGTTLSIGRGTDLPFQLIGHPSLTEGDTWFMPVTRPESIDPPLKNKDCRGFDLSELNLQQVREQSALDLSWLIKAYRAYPEKSTFFLKTGYFEKIAGTRTLREDLINGKTEGEIRARWKEDLFNFETIRDKYLIYGT